MPLRITRRPPSPFWYLRGTVRGQIVYETTGTDDAKTADAVRIKRESELLERSVFGPLATVTFAAAALSYLEAGGEARCLGRYDEKAGRWTLLIGHFGNMPLREIGQVEADEAARALLTSRAGPATRKRHIYVPLCAVLNHAARRGWCTAPNIRHPKVPAPVTKYSTPERLEKLLPHCNPKLRRLLVLMVYTGMRLGEATRVDWDHDVDFTQRTITIRRTKNGKMRTARIPDPLLAELSTVPEARRHGRMFEWRQKGAVYRPLKRACKAAGVEYLPPHQQGRHTYATWLRIYAKRDLRGVMEDGGWLSVQSVVRYLNVVPGETAAAVDMLPAVHAERKTGNGESPISCELRRKRKQNSEALLHRLRAIREGRPNRGRGGTDH